MLSKFLPIIVFLYSSVYAQCNEYDNATSCDTNDNCYWTSNIINYNCYQFGSSEACSQYSDYGCEWTWSWGGWGNHGNSCSGGSFQIDNGYCEEVILPDCSDMNSNECNSSDYCDWVVDISYGNCSSLTVTQCYSYPQECYVDPGLPGWYDSSGPPHCDGGTYQIDNSFCEDSEFMLGDLNGDQIINVLDVLRVIDIIMDSDYLEFADMNSDNIVNIQDVIYIVNIILNNE